MSLDVSRLDSMRLFRRLTIKSVHSKAITSLMYAGDFVAFIKE